MKEVENHQGYFITENGELFSSKSNRFLKGVIDRKGYRRFQFSDLKCERAHRLVAKAYISNPNNLPQVNHINEDKLDNRIENLEWCDNDYNANHSSHIWEVETPTGETLVVKNLWKWCKENNIHHGNLHHRGSSRGYKLTAKHLSEQVLTRLEALIILTL